MVRITQATEHDFPSVRRLFLEYIEWLIPIVETVWEYHIDVTPAEAVEQTMADIQKFMPTRTNYFSDPLRVLEQMTITVPFYAGVAYCLGALASKHRLLTEVFTYEKHDGDMTPPES